MLEEERKIDPNRLDEVEKQLRNEVARHTPYHERKQTITSREFLKESLGFSYPCRQNWTALLNGGKDTAIELPSSSV